MVESFLEKKNTFDLKEHLVSTGPSLIKALKSVMNKLMWRLAKQKYAIIAPAICTYSGAQKIVLIKSRLPK